MGEKIMDCVKQHPKCGAMCCKVITMLYTKRIPIRQGMMMTSRIKTMNADLKRYYELHNVQVNGEELLFRVGKYRWEGNTLILHKQCNLLGSDLLCKGHDDGSKPQLCKDFDMYTGGDGYWIPKDCLVQIGK